MRRALDIFGRGLLWLVVALCSTIIIAPKFLDAVYYRGAPTTHFDGQRFLNPDGEDDVMAGAGTPRQAQGSLAFRYVTGVDGRPPWPDKVPVTPAKPAARIEGARMVATWVGHATFLIQTQGLNILTDPVWSATAGPFGIGPRRVAEPGIRFNDLPRIDLVLVSHDHYDHLDLPTIRRLWARDHPLIVTSLGNDRVMSGVKATARDWGGRVTVRPGIDVIVTRNHHWGSRWFADRNRALWSSFVVTLPGGNLFFAGDTGTGDGKWPDEAAAYGPVRLALIPIGAFRFAPGQMAAGSHIGPIDAAEVFTRLRASRALGMHWGTFRLSYEAYDTPSRMLAAVLKCRGQTGFDAVPVGSATVIEPYRAPAKPVVDFKACLNSTAVTSLR